jgi:DNA-binding CsgD family transcriptional regulator
VSSNPPWSRYASSVDSWLEPAAIAAIRDELPGLADEIVHAIQQEVPGYSRPLRGEFGQGIRTGVELALRRFTGDVGDDSPAIYRRLGYGELRAGRSLDALQSAYRVGARVAWRRMSQAVAGTGATAAAQRELAAAMFAYIDQIAGESVEGYAEAQLARASGLERHRAGLFTLLLSTPPPESTMLSAAAAEARWPIPPTLACLLVESRGAAATVHQLSGDALHGPVGDLTCIIVPNPSRVEHEARAIVRRLDVVGFLGPSVATGDALVSLRWAELARELPLEDTRLIVAERRLADIALHAAPDIVAALSERVLQPLAGESERSRVRLEETLLAWLRRHGSQRAIAAELSVHPQTVRYRLRRLRDLFGASLEDPDRRFDLEVALRGRCASRRAGHGVGKPTVAPKGAPTLTRTPSTPKPEPAKAAA